MMWLKYSRGNSDGSCTLPVWYSMSIQLALDKFALSKMSLIPSICKARVYSVEGRIPGLASRGTKMETDTTASGLLRL